MPYQTVVKLEEEPLPWTAYIPASADKLILGTFPTQSINRAYQFYYPNPANKLWKILAHIASTELTCFEGEPAITERKDILNSLKLGMTDMGKVILRQQASSLDNNLFPIEYMDIFRILDDHPTIKTVILTSSSKGTSVLSWFCSYCELNEKRIKHEGLDFPKATTLIVSNREINIVLVCSTSGAAGKSFSYLLDLYSQVIN